MQLYSLKKVLLVMPRYSPASDTHAHTHKEYTHKKTTSYILCILTCQPVCNLAKAANNISRRFSILNKNRFTTACCGRTVNYWCFTLVKLQVVDE